MKKIYIDSGVLISAIRGEDAEMTKKAMEVLLDSDKEFVSSILVKLEVLPKATYEKRKKEVEFYQKFFDSVTYWQDSLDAVSENAMKEACRCGLNGIDALHIASALSVGAEEFITTERPGKNIHRVKSIKMVSIHS